MAWFGARTLYHHKNKKANDGSELYEERIVLIKADDFDDAISKAEIEAEKYEISGSEGSYIGFVNVYMMYDETIQNQTEVYSLMRESKLNPNDYITAFFDSGTERTKE